ncbi:Gfo/Idh/MocA family oxidoreductase [Metabacillus dongyingensis]|uniref:Gfo/Idh/MocA family protein n=1 Tax=Metabacillus dongyingensis TaxID=2874282 RepID=UPI003B8DB65B
MKVGIISFAHMHAHSYASVLKEIDGVILVGIADENEARGRDAADKFGVTYYFDFNDLLAEDIDAVIVTSENSNHHRHVTAAAKAGKHILCEKPLGTTMKEMEEMVLTCQKHGVKLQTAFPVRFNTSIQEAEKIIKEGKLGRVIAMKGTNRGTNPGGWFVNKSLSGGGAVMDHTVHVVDIMRWFLNAEVTEVYAEADAFFSDEIDDCGILTMEFDNGVFATLDCSWSRNKTYPTWGDVTLEVIGSEGTIFIDAFGQKLNVYSDENGTKWHYWGDDMDKDLIKDFITCVKLDLEPSITGQDGLKAVEVALAAYQAVEQKSPVKLE